MFGSHLYGTETLSSDRDYKSVYLPTSSDILLQRIKPVVVNNTKANNKTGLSEKNTTADVDDESFSLDKFLHLVAQGQTVALDVLFAVPPELVRYQHHVWRELYTNRDKLASKQSASFLGYCRQQSHKYGVKGSRVAAVRHMVRYLETVVSDARRAKQKVGDFDNDIRSCLNFLKSEYAFIENITLPGKPEGIPHINVCNRKVPYTFSMKEAHKIYSTLLAEYGKRAEQAEKNEGVDWKALSHAVRIGRQAVEYLDTGFITFKRPEAAHLVAIKTGQLVYQQVAEEIEELMVEVEKAAQRSSLPDQPDREWIDAFLFNTYQEVVINKYFSVTLR